jgi:hypothetical protein
MKEDKNPQQEKVSIILFVLIVAIAAPVINNYVLEDVFFTGNSFNFIFLISLTFLELTFLTFSIHVVFAIHGIKWLYRLFISKKNNADELVPKDPAKYSLLVIPSMILYGLASGILVRLLVDGYSLLQCIGRMLMISMFWGLIFRYFWNKGYLLVFYDWIYNDDLDR